MVLLALGLRVGVLTKVAKDDLALLVDLRDAEIFIFPVFSSETTAIENVLPDPNSDQRRCFRRGFAGTFRPDDLPPVKARLYYVGTIITDEIDLMFLRALGERGPIALDVQGCLRKVVGDELVTDGWDWADEALPLVQFLKVDDKEAQALTGESDVHKAAEILGGKGPQEVVLTQRGGVLVWAKGSCLPHHSSPDPLWAVQVAETRVFCISWPPLARGSSPRGHAIRSRTHHS